MASSINASTSGAGGVITTADSSGILNIQTAGTNAVTINASQNVGIGLNVPVAKLDVVGNAWFRGGVAAGAVGLITPDPTSGANGVNIAASFASGGYGPLTFSTNATERMRIDSSGNLLVGTTSSLSGSRINLVNGLDPYPLILRTSGAAAGNFWFVGPNAANNYVTWNQNGTGVYIVNGGTSWTGISDERLKTDLKPIENAINKVSTLRAVTGRFKTDEEGTSRSFLIAQDVQKVLPEAVSEQDDELKTLGLAYTETIPLLVAAIKEQQTIINDLKARITALEGAA